MFSRDNHAHYEDVIADTLNDVCTSILQSCFKLACPLHAIDCEARPGQWRIPTRVSSRR